MDKKIYFQKFRQNYIDINQQIFQAHLEHDFDHVLRSLVQVGLVKDIPEAVEDGVDAARRDFRQLLAALLQEGDGHLDGVVGGPLEQQRQDFQGQDLVRNLSVNRQDIDF